MAECANYDLPSRKLLYRFILIGYCAIRTRYEDKEIFSPIINKPYYNDFVRNNIDWFEPQFVFRMVKVGLIDIDDKKTWTRFLTKSLISQILDIDYIVHIDIPLSILEHSKDYKHKRICNFMKKNNLVKFSNISEEQYVALKLMSS